MAMFELVDLSIGYGDRIILEGLSFDLVPGTIKLVTGRNATGKTTLFKAMHGTGAWLDGKLLFDNVSMSKKSFLSKVRKKSGWMLQSRPVFPGVTSIDILKALYSNLDSKGRFLEKRDNIIKQLPSFERLLKIDTNYFSGGESAIFSLAVTLFLEPECLFLDEPFAGVDNEVSLEMSNAISSYVKEKNVTCMLIEHRKDVGFEAPMQKMDLDQYMVA